VIFLCLSLTLVEAWARLHSCMTGPGINTPGMPSECFVIDMDNDGDVDLRDIAHFFVLNP
jgi:hypothetical protein